MKINMENRFIDTPMITIIQDTCNKCGLCSKICPIMVFEFSKGEIPDIQNKDECVLCGQCLCVCPTNSINHSGFEKSNFQNINNLTINAEFAYNL
jgi:NAD-dependent dihydropyrimidine dehydrogenase PreA subunit